MTRRLDRRQRLAVAFGVLGWAILSTYRPFQGVPEELAGVRWIVLGRADGALPVRVAALGPGAGGADVWLAWARLEQGRVAAIELAVNVTSTPHIAERGLVSRGGALAYASGPAAGGVTHVEAIETDRAAARPPDLSLLEALTARLSALERWGQPDDPRLTRVELGEERAEAELGLDVARALTVATPDGALTVDLERGARRAGLAWATVTRLAPASPSPFRFAVDSLRHSELVGPERLQELEGVYHAGSDSVNALREALPLDADAAADLPGRRAGASIRGWPPPPLVPILEPAQPGEGAWIERDDRFATRPEGAPPPLFTTYLRADPERAHTSRVYVAIWDPAWVELDFVAGTLEPRSEGGLRGHGVIPPEVLPRVVAAFNGGFQTADSPSGMRTTQGLFLPAVAYTSTVARLSDGRIGLGTWPVEELGPRAPPLYRQNLQPLIEDGVIDPYRRRFWGGSQRGRRDTTRTDRSGLCLTGLGHMAYLYGRYVTPDAFGEAMRTAGCTYGMMLDINSTNTVFESYRVGRALPPLDRELDPELEAEGVVPEHESLRYRMQALARPMTDLGRPRYVRREFRDFFYLALRPEVVTPPGSAICAPRPRHEEGSGPPRAWACELDEPLAGVALELYDLRRTRIGARAAAAPPPDAGTPSAALVFVAGEVGGTTARLLGPEDELPPDATVLPGRAALEVPATGEAQGAVLGVAGPLLFTARTPARLAAATARRLRDAGVERAIFIAGDPGLSVAPDDTPMAVRIFEDTTAVPRHEWRPRLEKILAEYRALGLARVYVSGRNYSAREADE